MDETTFTSAQVLGIIERVAADEIARTTSTEEKLRVRRLAKKFVAEIRDQPRG